MVGQQTKDRGKTSPAVMCIKILLQIFNLIYLIIGACVLAVGIWTKIELSKYFELTGMYFEQAPYIMIGVGAVIVLVAFGGFFCTAKDKVALLYMYAVFIIILAVCQLAAGIAGAVMRNELTDKFRKGLQNSLNETNIVEWDTVQRNLKCCGVEQPEDWLKVNDGKLPASCWSDNKEHPYTPGTMTTSEVSTVPNRSSIAGSSGTPSTPSTILTTSSKISATPTPTSSTSLPNGTVNKPAIEKTKRSIRTGEPEVYAQGCADKVEETMSHSLGVIVGTCIGFVFLQILGAIFACCLAKKTSRNNYEQIY